MTINPFKRKNKKLKKSGTIFEVRKVEKKGLFAKGS
jgi:hypothetical protein